MDLFMGVIGSELQKKIFHRKSFQQLLSFDKPTTYFHTSIKHLTITMIAASVFDTPGREPLLKNHNNNNDEENPPSHEQEPSSSSSPQLHVNLVWLSVGLLLGMGLQIGWTYGIFVTLASLAQQTTLQIALVVVTSLLLSKCLLLNIGAYWVISQMKDEDDEIETTHETRTTNNNNNPQSSSSSSFVVIHSSLTPLLELTIGGVLGMFVMALALQVAPWVDPTVVSVTTASSYTAP